VRNLRDLAGKDQVIGLGLSLVQAAGGEIPGLRSFPALTGPAIEIPTSPFALWIWLLGDDRGDLLHRGLEFEEDLAPDFVLEDVIEGFQYRESRDLTGYVDGTENPEGEAAAAAAIVHAAGPGLDGSSFVAVQQWAHDLDRFRAFGQRRRDETIGRRQSDNEEMADAPSSAHVKRAAQEDFTPEAFMVRRSMPWVEGLQAGLLFVAFGKSFDAFEAVLRRMIGSEDGVRDALFDFSRPVSGSYYWCPPVTGDRLDLSAMGG